MNKVSIYGGLGNQMFQYALCIALNQKGRKTKVSFSNFLYEYHHNGFNLGKAFKLKFSFPLNLLNFFLLNCGFLYKNRYASFIARRVIRFYHKKRYTIYREIKEFVYDQNVFRQQSSFLVGVWQVEIYFKDFKNIIEKEFLFREPSDKNNIVLKKKISSCNSVSIHIRRGDYESAYWKTILGFINDNNYYRNALVYVNKKVEDPRFFIFSDDIEWAKANIKISNCTYVEHNKAEKSYIDMYLMSLCKHNIIANSTFSWWAAWLNKNINKIVVMPEKWIIRDYSPEGICPENWMKISGE